MAKLTWLGSEDYREGESPPESCVWNGVLFTAGDKVDVTDEWMIKKARGNRFFKVEEEPWPALPALPEDYYFSNPPEPAKKPTEPEPEQSLPIGLMRPEAWTNTPPAAFPDYPPEDDREPLKRKRGRPPKVRTNGDGDQ